MAEFVRENISFPKIPKELESYVIFKSGIRLITVHGDKNCDYDEVALNVKSYPAKGYYNTLILYIDTKKNKRNTTTTKAPNGTKKLYDKWQEHLTKKNEFMDILENSLLSINTEKQLKTHLPELEKFLPKKNCGLVPIESFKEVRKELKGL